MSGNKVRMVAYGVGVWLVPFLVGMVLFGLRSEYPELFKALVAVAVALGAVVFGFLWVRRVNQLSITDGIRIGIAWFAICLTIDVPLFVGAFDMGLSQYLADIGPTYLMVPIIVAGFAAARSIPVKEFSS